MNCYRKIGMNELLLQKGIADLNDQENADLNTS